MTIRLSRIWSGSVSERRVKPPAALVNHTPFSLVRFETVRWPVRSGVPSLLRLARSADRVRARDFGGWAGTLSPRGVRSFGARFGSVCRVAVLKALPAQNHPSCLDVWDPSHEEQHGAVRLCSKQLCVLILCYHVLRILAKLCLLWQVRRASTEDDGGAIHH